MEYPELCYGLPLVEMLDPSIKEVTPIIIKRGETGYHRTNWHWNKTNAKEALDHCNAKLGVTPEMADEMMTRSMFGWPDSAHRQNERELC